MESISDDEIQNLKRIEKKIHKKHFKSLVWWVIIPILLGLIPRELVPLRGMRGEGSLIGYLGIVDFLIAFLIVNIIVQLLTAWDTKPFKIKKDLRDKKKQRHTGIIIDGVKEDSDVILVLKDSEFKRLVIYDSDISRFQKGQKIEFETYQHSKHVVSVLE